MQNSILAYIRRPLWRALEVHQIDADTLFSRQGTGPSFIQEPRARYPYYLLFKAWTADRYFLSELVLACVQTTTPNDILILDASDIESGLIVKAKLSVRIPNRFHRTCVAA